MEMETMILRRRGIAITHDQQRHVIACTLDRWLDRAFSVASVDELLA
jgi:hypothetical protein